MMKTKTCETCEHWQNPHKDMQNPSYADYGLCNAAIHVVKGPSDSDNDPDEWGDGEAYKYPDMMVMDGSGYRAELFTVKTHSCGLYLEVEQ